VSRAVGISACDLVLGSAFGADRSGWWVERRHLHRATERSGLTHAGDVAAARVRPLAWGLTAALLGTLAANAFYLTMTFAYFYFLLGLAFAAPVVFGRRLDARNAS
jgi:hypothetical protein